MLYFIFFGFFLLFGLGYYASIKILNFLVSYFSEAYNLKLIAISPYDVLLTVLRIDLLLVSIIAIPCLLIWGILYAAPALYEKEKSYLWYLPSMFILAVVGLISGWFLTIKIFIPYLQVFSSFVNIQNNWSILELISFVLAVCLMFVLTFQMPIVFTVLVNLKVIKLDKVATIRKAMIVLALLFGAIVTPQTDPVSQVTVAVPFYILFEATMQYSLIKKKFKKNK